MWPCRDICYMEIGSLVICKACTIPCQFAGISIAVYVGHIRTHTECPIPNLRQSTAKGKGFQAHAHCKCHFANSGNRIRNNKVGEVTLGKSLCKNLCHTRWDVYGLQACRVMEGTLFNGCYAFWQGEREFLFLTKVCFTTNGHDAIRNGRSDAAQYELVAGCLNHSVAPISAVILCIGSIHRKRCNRTVCKVTATVDRGQVLRKFNRGNTCLRENRAIVIKISTHFLDSANRRKTFRQGDSLKACATTKSTSADSSERRRSCECDRREGFTLVESIIADGRYAGWNGNSGQSIAVMEQILTNSTYLGCASEIDGVQFLTVHKAIFTQGGHTFRDGDGS